MLYAIFHATDVLIVPLIVAWHAYRQIPDHFPWIINVNVYQDFMNKILRIVENVITVVQNVLDYRNFNVNHVLLLTIDTNQQQPTNACAYHTIMMMGWARIAKYVISLVKNAIIAIQLIHAVRVIQHYLEYW